MLDLLKASLEKKGALVNQADAKGLTPLIWGT